MMIDQVREQTSAACSVVDEQAGVPRACRLGWVYVHTKDMAPAMVVFSQMRG